MIHNKDEKVREMAREFEGYPVDPRFAGYFILFNQGRYYEAHDVLESLWLPIRRGPEGDFYKGLIQLAGAFVHVQKGRAGSAYRLLRLARTNLARFPLDHMGLDGGAVVRFSDDWLRALENEPPLPHGFESMSGVVAPWIPLPW